MTSVLGPVLVLLAAVVLTYVCCIHPMRRGQCRPPPAPGRARTRKQREELARLRADVAQLRAHPAPAVVEPHSAEDPGRL